MNMENPITKKNIKNQLICCGFILLITFSIIGYLSHSDTFIWGHADSNRPLLEFSSLYLFAWLIFAWAFYIAGKIKDMKYIYFIIFIGVLLRVLMFTGNPIQADDFYRYIWDGSTLKNGQNPSALSPSEMEFKDMEIAPEQLDEAIMVRSRVNHPDYKTIYPHGAQATFVVNVVLWDWDIYGLRKTFLFFDLGLILIFYLILKRLKLPLGFLLIYSWNPLVLKEVYNNMHIDIVACFFLALYILAIAYERRTLACLAIVAAASVKLTPILILPCLLLYQWRKKDYRGAIFNALLAANLLLLGVITAYIGSTHPFEGLIAFSNEWQFNGGIFELTLYLIEKCNISNGLKFTKFLLLTIYLFSMACYLYYKLKDRDSLFACSAWVLFILLLISPVVNPWYLLWVLPFMLISRNVPFLLMMIFSFVYYLHRWVEYNHVSDVAFKFNNYLFIGEYCLFFILFGAYLIYKYRQKAGISQKNL